MCFQERKVNGENYFIKVKNLVKHFKNEYKWEVINIVKQNNIAVQLRFLQTCSRNG